MKWKMNKKLKQKQAKQLFKNKETKQKYNNVMWYRLKNKQTNKKWFKQTKIQNIFMDDMRHIINLYYNF